MFYAFLLGIILIPIAMIIPALRNKRPIVVANRDAENINIARQRMQEIEKFKAHREINIEEAQLELQATLLEDLRADKMASQSVTSSGTSSSTTTVAFKGWGVLIILLIPLLSLGLYSYLGSPQFALQTIADIEQAKQADNELDIHQLLAQLEARLEQDAESAQSWALAARTYMTLGDYQKAESAYAKLNALVLGNSDFLTAWADAEIMLNGNNYTPAAKARIGKALALNPNHINALWIASLGSESLGEHAEALVHLNTLLPLLTDDKQSPAQIDRFQIEQMIGRNHSFLDADSGIQKHKPNEPASGKTITVQVMLADKLVAQANKNDWVWVFAKALQGPQAPLAVSKHRVKDLPIEVVLSENMAMLPGLSIASFEQITVTARVSKTGNAIQQPGDLVSDTRLVTTKNQQNTVQLSIDRIVE